MTHPTMSPSMFAFAFAFHVMSFASTKAAALPITTTKFLREPSSSNNTRNLLLTEIDEPNGLLDTTYGPFDIPQYDPSDEDGTIWMLKIPDFPHGGGTSLRCELQCTSGGAEADFLIVYRTGDSAPDTRPGGVNTGACPRVVGSGGGGVDDVYLLIGSDDPTGLNSAFLRCCARTASTDTCFSTPPPIASSQPSISPTISTMPSSSPTTSCWDSLYNRMVKFWTD